MEAREGSRASALLLAALLLACAATVSVGADPCVRSSALASGYTIAVLDDDTLTWWGQNAFVGVATGNRIASLPSSGDILSASGSHYFYCALRRNGTVYCRGDGATFDVSGLTDVTSIATGIHVCALDKWGKVYCVGYNGFGQLGTGDNQDRTTPTLVQGLLSGDGRAIAISAGYFHTCVLVDDGGATAVKCFGSNEVGQLGNGDLGHDSTTPVIVKDLEMRVKSVSAGYHHTCVLMDDSTVRCFGGGQWGQLGRGMMEDSAVPVPVPGLSGVVAIAASAGYTCALLSDATVSCWGCFDNLPTIWSPMAVPGLIRVRSLSSGSTSYMACAILLNGGLSCWGAGFLGGEGDDWQYSYAPVTVQGLSGCSVAPPGDTGPQGPQGFQGPEGFQGPGGAQGPAGLQGAPGPEGPSGAAGAQGPGGFQGPTGFWGPEGPQGLAGTQGDQGAAGAQGAAGLRGPEGPQGLAGAQGDRGAVGAQGLTGFRGPEGPQGHVGAQGDRGVKGSRGPAGPTGFQGSAGFQGPAGIPGSAGVQGPAGAQGLKGPRGDNLGNRLVAVLPRNITLTVAKQADSSSLPCPAGTQPVFATWKPSTDAGGSTSLWGATCNAWISPSEARALGSCSFRCRIALIISSAGSPVATSAPKMLPTTTASAELLCLCINTVK